MVCAENPEYHDTLKSMLTTVLCGTSWLFPGLTEAGFEQVIKTSVHTHRMTSVTQTDGVR